MPLSWAATVAFPSKIRSFGPSVVWPFTQVCVNRIVSKPTSFAARISDWANIGSAVRALSSATPMNMYGPPAKAGAAHAKNATSATSRPRTTGQEYPQDPMAHDEIEAQLKRVPAASGVYLFRDAKGDVLYVGKAKTLRP